jgi:hypothetical protein
MRISPDQPDDIKQRNPIADIFGERVKLGRPNRRGIRAGACLCEPQRGKAPLWVDTTKQTWGCLKGDCGGDVFDYLRQFEGLDFRAALGRLGGAPAPVDPETAARAEAERERRQRERAEQEATEAEAERARAWELWRAAEPAAGTLIDAYFLHRGLAPLASRSLRFLDDAPYYLPADNPGDPPQIIHRSPAMVAAIVNAAGRFWGCHRTWLDPRLASGPLPREASGKAEIRAPDSELLPAKKMRGSKRGGAIRLADPPAGAGRVILLLGEGIETTTAALQACQRHGAPGLRFAAWAACDLTNLSGGGLGPSTPHQTRPGRWVPPEDPNPAAPGVLPPAWADVTIILGDGDSDPVVTSARLECARRRFLAAGRAAAVAMAPTGSDFNDVARGISA